MISAALLLASAAAAAEVSAPSPSELQVHAWASGGYRMHSEQAEDSGFYVGMARLVANYEHGWQRSERPHAVHTFLQVEAASGSVDLLDARLDYQPAPWLRLRAGRFKAPVSADYLVPATKMLLAERAMLVDLAPRRLIGAEAAVQAGKLGAEVALFEWDEDLLTVGEAHYSSGPVALHAAAGQRSGETNDTRLDAAVVLHPGRWEAHAEALAVLDGGAVPAVGAFASAGYRFGDPATEEDALAVEPLVALDLRSEDGGQDWAGTGAVDIFWDGWHLVQTLSYTHAVADGVPDHVLTAQLRGGF